MSEIVIYGDARSTYVRTVRMACVEKGIGHVVEGVDIKSDAYRALHPYNKMPSMQHGDVRLYETLAICSYVDDAFDGPALQPADPAARARMMQWISAINAYLYPTILGGLIFPRLVAPMRGETPDEAKIAAALPEIERQIGLVEDALGEHDWLAADSFSLADMFLCPIFTYVGVTPEGEKLLADRPNIARAGAAINARPCAVETMPPMG